MRITKRGIVQGLCLALLVAGTFAAGLALGVHKGRNAEQQELTSDGAELSAEQTALLKALVKQYPEDFEELSLNDPREPVTQEAFWSWLKEGVESLGAGPEHERKRGLELARTTWHIAQEDCALANSGARPHSDTIRALAAAQVLASWWTDKYKQDPHWKETLFDMSLPWARKTEVLPRVPGDTDRADKTAKSKGPKLDPKLRAALERLKDQQGSIRVQGS